MSQVELPAVEMRDGPAQVGLPALAGRGGWSQVGLLAGEGGCGTFSGQGARGGGAGCEVGGDAFPPKSPIPSLNPGILRKVQDRLRRMTVFKSERQRLRQTRRCPAGPL